MKLLGVDARDTTDRAKWRGAIGRKQATQNRHDKGLQINMMMFRSSMRDLSFVNVYLFIYLLNYKTNLSDVRQIIFADDQLLLKYIQLFLFGYVCFFLPFGLLCCIMLKSNHTSNYKFHFLDFKQRKGVHKLWYVQYIIHSETAHSFTTIPPHMPEHGWLL